MFVPTRAYFRWEIGFFVKFSSAVRNVRARPLSNYAFSCFIQLLHFPFRLCKVTLMNFKFDPILFSFFFLNRKFNGLLNSAKWDFGDTDITHPLENGTETVHQSTFGLNKPVHLKSTIDYLITKSFCQKFIHCFKNVKTS